MKPGSILLYPILMTLALYGLSLAVPAFEFVQLGDRKLQIWRGWEILMLGWLGLFYWQIGWLANHLYYINLVLVWKRFWRSSVILGIITVAVGLNTLFLFSQKIPYNGAGATMQLRSLQIGFYFWIVSLSIPFLWSCWQLWTGASRSQGSSKDV
jgi:hypothetical protein